jgi:hypothetical protein
MSMYDEFDTCGECGGVTFGIKNRVRMCTGCYDEVPLDPPSEDDEEDEEEVPPHQREDGLALARMEMMYDDHTDPEGGDLYDDADNPEMPCPLCGKYDDFCVAWGECDGTGEPPSEEDVNNSPLEK